MSTRSLHLVRHGEVYNPDGVLYGRLPGFHLSERGHEMAATTARYLADQGLPVATLIVSPLQRAQESAQPISDVFGLPIATEPRVIEPMNRFEGKSFEPGGSALKHPASWPLLVNPFRPSWGEAYKSIAARMVAAMTDAWNAGGDGDVVIVSHQLPIWMVHRSLAGEPLFHDPRARRCALSSVTSFTYDDAKGRFVETGYADPNEGVQAVDGGAV